MESSEEGVLPIMTLKVVRSSSVERVSSFSFVWATDKKDHRSWDLCLETHKV